MAMRQWQPMRATYEWKKGARNHITPPNGMPLFAAMARI
jgi:hypothetical protein